MPCETVVIQGTEQPDPVRPSIIDTSGTATTNRGVLQYTVNNVNDFPVEVTVRESLTNTDTGVELQSNTVNLTIEPNGEDAEQIIFNVEGISESGINAQMCAEVTNFTPQQ